MQIRIIVNGRPVIALRPFFVNGNKTYNLPMSQLEHIEAIEKRLWGAADTCWVPNVVFTCGAVPREDHKKILDAEDELLIYYGASDTVISIATAKVGDLIPEEFR